MCVVKKSMRRIKNIYTISKKGGSNYFNFRLGNNLIYRVNIFSKYFNFLGNQKKTKDIIYTLI